MNVELMILLKTFCKNLIQICISFYKKHQMMILVTHVNLSDQGNDLACKMEIFCCTHRRLRQSDYFNDTVQMTCVTSELVLLS